MAEPIYAQTHHKPNHFIDHIIITHSCINKFGFNQGPFNSKNYARISVSKNRHCTTHIRKGSHPVHLAEPFAFLYKHKAQQRKWILNAISFINTIWWICISFYIIFLFRSAEYRREPSDSIYLHETHATYSLTPGQFIVHTVRDFHWIKQREWWGKCRQGRQMVSP